MRLLGSRGSLTSFSKTGIYQSTTSRFVFILCDSGLLQPFSSYVLHAQVYDALCGLKRVDVSVEILKKTKIGQSVNSIKKKYTAHQAINDTAKELVLKWKRTFEKSQVAAPKPSPVIAAEVAPASPVPSSEAIATAESAKPLIKKDLNYMLTDLSEPRKNVRLFFMYVRTLSRDLTSRQCRSLSSLLTVCQRRPY